MIRKISQKLFSLEIKKDFPNKTGIPFAPLKPGLKHKILGHLAEISEIAKQNKNVNAHGFFEKYPEWSKQTNSKTFKIRIIRREDIISFDPEFYKETFSTKQHLFTNAIGFKRILGYFFPTGVIVVDGDQWVRIRKILQRAINRTNLNPIIQIMTEIKRDLFSQKDKSNDLLVNHSQTLHIASRITFDSFFRLTFDWDPKTVSFDEKNLKLLNHCDMISTVVGIRKILPYPFLWKLPTKTNRQADTSKKFVRDFAMSFIQKQKQLTNLDNKESEIFKKKNRSLLEEMLIASEFSDDMQKLSSKEGMNNEELIDNIMVLFFGAYDTTSSNLVFLLNYLARYPRVQEKVRKIILDKFPNKESDFVKANIDEIDRITYLTQIIDEVNRLCAIAPAIGKTALEDCEIAGNKIKKGQVITILNIAIGREEKFWNGQTDLDEFRPERWEEHKPSVLENVLPFSLGSRMCPGRKIALLEMKCFLILVLMDYKVNLRVPNEKMEEFTYKISKSFKDNFGNINFTKI